MPKWAFHTWLWLVRIVAPALVVIVLMQKVGVFDIDEIVAFLRSLGDSLGMVGDCSVSGNYGITLDCDVSQKAGDGVPRSVPILPGPAVLASQHEEEYSVALEHAVQAPTKISEEMQRIRSGQVAHYDFLQYEHIEMLRYARALSFPPANVESEQREAMLLQAAQWQQSADQYELIIADFLRMQAVASSARANYQDLLQLFSSGADEKTLSLLANAQQSVLEFYVQPNSDTQLVFESSTRALHELSLNPQRLEELKLQLRLLLENVSIPQV